MDSQARIAEDRQIVEEMARRALLRHVINEQSGGIESVMKVAFKAGWRAGAGFEPCCEVVTEEFRKWLRSI